MAGLENLITFDMGGTSTDVALLQIGGDCQEEFLKEAAEPLLAALRSEGDR